MKRRYAAVVALLLSALVAAAAVPPRASQAAPRLVVLVSVDQLRADLLDEYAPLFEGGFRRLVEEGRSYPGASHAHAVTHTAAGHATLGTGVHPARSGIVANSWDHRTAEGWQGGMYAVADPDSPILGFPEASGRSPRNLLRDGLADWVAAADPDARVVSVSGKDRAAITLAARARGHVYWFLPDAGRFVTSVYYRDEYPDWVEDYNETVVAPLLADTVWTSGVSQEHRILLARPDEGAPYEGDGVHTTFPHLASQELEDPTSLGALAAWALRQPRSDRAVAGLAMRAVDELELGTRGPVDFLAVSFSSTDYIGHDYGPFSQEQLDNLNRLDEVLGELFAHLDRSVGEGNWVLGFSADHGTMNVPETMSERGQVGRRVVQGERLALATRAVNDAVAAAGGDTTRLPVELARILEERAIVDEAYTHEELLVGPPADSFAVLFRNSYHPGRGPGWFSRFGVEARFEYHELVGYPTGTSHGSPYWYDRWVPFVLMGAGVEPGTDQEAVFTIDMAPTLARLVGLEPPVDLDGRAVLP